MIEQVHEAMFHWYRRVGAGRPLGGRSSRPGCSAAMIPAAPERAVVNAVLFRTPAELGGRLRRGRRRLRRDRRELDRLGAA